jgi:hypothetical protein
VLSHTCHVTVTLPRPHGDEALAPAGGQAVIELTAAAIAAEGLLTAWTCTKSVVSMIVERPSVADALEVGVAVARALHGGDGMTSVTAEPATPPAPAVRLQGRFTRSGQLLPR